MKKTIVAIVTTVSLLFIGFLVVLYCAIQEENNDIFDIDFPDYE